MSNLSSSPTPDRPGSWPWLRERLFPRGTNLIQWASYVIIISELILEALNPPPVTSLQYSSAMVALALLLVINILWDDLRAVFPTEVIGSFVLLVISTALTMYILGIGRMYSAIYLLFMIVAQANAMLPLLPALALTLVQIAVLFGVLLLQGLNRQEMQGTAIGVLIGMTFTVTLSQVLNRYTEQSRQMRQLLAQIQQANTELLSAREKEKELVIAEERVRMARDLHDGLGHHLTALSIQLQAAEKLVRANPETAAEMVHNARGEVQAALKEVRQSVAVLRETPVDIQNLPEAIARLVTETGHTAGMKASFEQTGYPLQLSPAAAMTLYRSAQEGLTNVQKHAAQASQVYVRMTCSAEEISLLVEDDGKMVEPAVDPGRGGFGLAGLRERATLLGGKLECGPRTDGGFQMKITLPANGGSA